MLEEKSTVIIGFTKCDFNRIFVKIWTSNKHKTRIRCPIEPIYFSNLINFFVISTRKNTTHCHRTYNFTFIGFWPYIGQNYKEKTEVKSIKKKGLPHRFWKHKQVWKMNRPKKMLEEKSTAIWSFKKCDFKGVLVKIWTLNRHKTRIRFAIEPIFFKPDYFFDIYAKKHHALP